MRHDCRTTASAVDALVLIETFEPELALLDIGLPDLSGYELLDALRARLGPRAPYVASLTGWYEGPMPGGGGAVPAADEPALSGQLSDGGLAEAAQVAA